MIHLEEFLFALLLSESLHCIILREESSHKRDIDAVKLFIALGAASISHKHLPAAMPLQEATKQENLTIM